MAIVVQPTWRGLSLRRAAWLQALAIALVLFAWYRAEEPASLEPLVAVAQSDAATINMAAPEPALPAPGAATDIQQANVGSTIEVIVGRNDTLDRIFRRLELDLTDLANLRALPDLRGKLDRLYPGDLVKVIHDDGTLLGLERRLSDSETLKVTRADSGFAADVLENPLDVRVLTAQSTIRSSLFQATSDANLSDAIAVRIADVFAYDIDFVLDIQQGDSFVVTYEQIWRDGKYLRDGNILAVKFINNGREYRALRYTDESGHADYYAADGASLRKAFLRAPLEFSRVSSRFNLSRRHPVLNRIRAHKGVDYAAPSGTPVRAAGSGRVRFVGRKGGYGNVIELEHSRGIVTVYGHLSRFAKGMKRGAKVDLGKVIGYVGMTGLATGPHLHYEYRLNGSHKDPQKVPLPKAEPIPAAQLALFKEQTAGLSRSLDFPVGPLLVAR